MSASGRVGAAVLLLVAATGAKGEVTLYAAASLSDVLSELARSYQKRYPGVVIKQSFAASSILARQIENGAPADIYISADTDWSSYLERRGLLLAYTRKNLLGNELALIAPRDQPLRVALDPLFDFAGSFSGRLCTGEPDHVPVGKYAKQALRHYGWWDRIAPRVVGTEDVRAALAFVARGECALGIVYRTDAIRDNKVRVVTVFPARSHSPIIYPGGLVKGFDPSAARFWDYLSGDEARGAFVRHGFVVEPRSE